MNFVVYLFVLIAWAPSFGFSQTIESSLATDSSSDIVSDGVQAVKGIAQDVQNTLTEGVSKILPQISYHESVNEPHLYEGGLGNGILEEGIFQGGTLEGGILKKGDKGNDYIFG